MPHQHFMTWASFLLCPTTSRAGVGALPHQRHCPACVSSEFMTTGHTFILSVLYAVECQMTCVLDTIVSLCHGKRKCVIDDIEGSYVSQCSKHHKKFLVIVHTCGELEALGVMFDVIKCGSYVVDEYDLVRRIWKPAKHSWVSNDG